MAEARRLTTERIVAKLGEVETFSFTLLGFEL